MILTTRFFASIKEGTWPVSLHSFRRAAQVVCNRTIKTTTNSSKQSSHHTMISATKTCLISIVTLSLLTSALGDSKPTICKHRHASCQRYQHECSISSCCEHLQTADQTAPTSGKYLLKTGTYSTSAAYCDMETNGGGWTVIMRRSNIEFSFERLYHEYEDGFGELDGEFWYGLRQLRDITSRTPYEMQLDMFDGANDMESTSNASYSNFKVEGDDYTLTLGNFSGSDPELMDNLIQFNNRPFIAEREKQQWIDIDRCIHDFKAGWWYANESCLAGTDQTPGTILTASYPLVEWYDISVPRPSRQVRIFQKYELKIRPLNCKVAESTT